MLRFIDEVTLNQEKTAYYPFSGADFSIITELHEYSKGHISNFIFCDSCIPENDGYHIFDDRVLQIENNLGLCGLRILDTAITKLQNEIDFSSCVKAFAEKQKPEYQQYLKNIPNPELVEYSMQTKTTTPIRLWFFKYEAAAVLNYIAAVLNPQNSPNFVLEMGLILRSPGTGITNSPFWKFLESEQYRPDFVNNDPYLPAELFTHYKIQGNEPFKWRPGIDWEKRNRAFSINQLF